MLYSYFESIKYVGHLYPIAFLRIYLGYIFFDSALNRVNGVFLTQPRLASVIMESLPVSDVPIWYANFLQYFVVPNWQFFAYLVTYCEFLIGICLLAGFLIRPVSILGVVLMLNLIYGGSSGALLQQTYLVFFVVIFWVGAGRCLGLDYYFYKRYRGIWW
jgi:thiosulfate dehydrogenase (quinone) large subunit